MKQPPIQSYTWDDCPEWVREYPAWSPWESGRAKALDEIRGWYGKHVPALRDEIPPQPGENTRWQPGENVPSQPGENSLPQPDENAPLVARMLTCLVSHWERTGKERPHTEIVDALEQGKGPDGGDLKGKPLFDLVLADALCDRQKKAGEYFGGNVLPKIQTTARYAYKLFGVQFDDDWQGDFYSYLIEIGVKNDKPLERYLGISGLLPWLRKILVGFLRDRFRKEGRYQAKIGSEAALNLEPDAPSPLEGYCNDAGTPLDLAMLNELTGLLRECVREALETLAPDERLRLAFFYAGTMKNQEIARLFKEKDYQTTRERQRAENRFLKAFSTVLESKMASHPAISESLPQLGIEVARILIEILQAETQGEES